MVVPVYDGVVGKGMKLMDKDPTHVWQISRYKWVDLIKNKFEIIEIVPHFRFPAPVFGYLFFELPEFLFRFSPAIMIIARKKV